MTTLCLCDFVEVGGQRHPQPPVAPAPPSSALAPDPVPEPQHRDLAALLHIPPTALIALAEADGRYRVEIQKCDALTAADMSACASRGMAELTGAKGNTLVRRDEVLAQAEHHG